MSFLIVAFQEGTFPVPTPNLPSGVTPLTDNVLSISGDSFVVPEDAVVLAAWAGSPTILSARVVSSAFLRAGSGSSYLPILTRGTDPVRPATGVGAGGEQHIAAWLDGPLKLRANDTVGIEASVATTLETVRGLLVLGFGVKPTPRGEVVVIRYTSTGTAANAVWTRLTDSLTLFSDLRDGVYVIVGHVHISATCVASRLIVPGQSWRPGGPGIAEATPADGLSRRSHRIFYDGSLGSWGQFSGYAPPGIEVLCTGPDADHVGYIRAIKIA